MQLGLFPPHRPPRQTSHSQLLETRHLPSARCREYIYRGAEAGTCCGVGECAFGDCGYEAEEEVLEHGDWGLGNEMRRAGDGIFVSGVMHSVGRWGRFGMGGYMI
jgi:hypothetical protein